MSFVSRPNAAFVNDSAAAVSASSTVASSSLDSLVSPHSSDLDLDAFDILDLPDFDSFIPAITPPKANPSEHGLKVSAPSFVPNATESRAGIANITEFCPDWSSQEGGTKVLVTGPWYSTTSPYTVLFDGISVPGTLVQSGVLRCFCPGHSPGLVSMQVACEGFVISNSCAFEYKRQEVSIADKQREWFGLSGEGRVAEGVQLTSLFQWSSCSGI
ncbi:hypothetical protein CAPTEDRAFT_124215 [Capitella teleta]|uniref:IPT/TIG domain-containing protein n=1 Tax=Capitella teleta TaxID=283909 RepID=R7U892_CAPTE|nr:hypothetical protein CAPTEDRAFT_124215 [Capitella teleta]|eukprot:ELT99886.1 hypothetical protein CAPTEDRAFT_124215 [Capitella teleta]